MALPFPHRYRVQAGITPDGDSTVSTDRATTLTTSVPAEFDGPGNDWSPETLFVASVVNCLALTFRGVARASHLGWVSLSCEGVGTLERVNGVVRFTKIDIEARLRIPADASPALAQRVLDRAEATCLVARSLIAPVELDAHIESIPVPLGSLSA